MLLIQMSLHETIFRTGINSTGITLTKLEKVINI